MENQTITFDDVLDTLEKQYFSVAQEWGLTPEEISDLWIKAAVLGDIRLKTYIGE